MSHIRVLVLLGGVTLCTPVSRSQQWQLREDIQRIYNFQSHVLTDQQRNDMSAAMDQFWDNVKTGMGSLAPRIA